jgi:hypothetical protein
MSRSAKDSLKSPPSGGKMRLPDAQSKPWEALGISRATWYRRDKPTEQPIRRGRGPFSQRKMAAGNHVSLRTQQRLDRILEFDSDLWFLTVKGHIKPAQAERIISDPVKYQHFLQWFTEQLDLTEYVLWTVNRQLDDLEGSHPRRRAPLLGIRKSAQGETVIYLRKGVYDDGVRSIRPRRTAQAVRPTSSSARSLRATR